MTRRSADLLKVPNTPGRAADPKSGFAGPTAPELQPRGRKLNVARSGLSRHVDARLQDRADEPEQRVRLERDRVQRRAAEPRPRDRRGDLLGRQPTAVDPEHINAAVRVGGVDDL